MILYDNNSRNWFKDILNSFKSKTLVLLFKRGVFVIILSSVNVYIATTYWNISSVASEGVFTIVGIALSIVMVFRTNTAYDRWWEGRKQWGDLVNNCRSIALLVDAKLPKFDEDNRHFFARYITNYAFALSAHLKGTFNKDKLYDLEDEDVKLLDIYQHPPNFIAKKLYSRTVRLLEQGHLSEFIELKMFDHLAGFNSITGACERIKNTPIPFSYRSYIKTFITFYVFMIPYIYADDLGYFGVIVTVLEFCVLAGLEMMAEEIENPFEEKDNDLPTHSLSVMIKNNVYEILGFYEEVEDIPEKDFYSIIN